jgi:MFS family permease
MGDEEPTLTASKAPTLRFWGIFAALCLLAFVSALDVAIISTALPFITAEVGGATQYVWIANSFVFASAALQPLTGQLANVLGRRVPPASFTVLFAIARDGHTTSIRLLLGSGCELKSKETGANRHYRLR